MFARSRRGKVAPKWRHWSIAVAVLLLGVGSYFGATSVAAQGAAKPQTLTLGGSFELSGALAGIGHATYEGVQLAVRDINSHGGFQVGGKLYKLALTSRDNRSDPVTSVNIAREFTQQDHISFLIGPSFATAATPTFPIAQQANALQFTVATTAEQFLGTPGYTNLFRTLAPDAVRAATMPALVSKAGSFNSIAFVLPDDALGHLKGDTYSAAFGNAGVKVTSVAYYPAGTKDFSTILTKVAQGSPQAIFAGYPDANASAIIRQALDQNITSKFVGETGVSLGAARPYGSRVAWFSITAFSADPNSPDKNVARWRSEYKQMFGFLPRAYAYPAPLAYDSVGMLVAAMKKAGTTTDVGKISAALRGMHYSGLVRLYVSPTNRLYSGYDIETLQHGKKKDYSITLDQVIKALGGSAK